MFLRTNFAQFAFVLQNNLLSNPAQVQNGELRAFPATIYPLIDAMINRRTFLVASTVGYAGLRMGRPLHGSPTGKAPRRTRPAKSTILFFLCGGASHIDTWDMKPDAPLEYRGVFQPMQTSVPGIRLCEHLPMTAAQAHHLAIVQGVTDGGKATGDHHAGYYYNLTGRIPDNTFRTQGNDRRPYPEDWPFMGSVVGSQLPQHPNLPQVITLPHKPSKAPYTRPGQFAARLGVQHDPFYLSNDPNDPLKFLAPTLSLDGSLTPDRMADRRSLLEAFNGARRQLDHDHHVQTLDVQQEKAFRLLASTATADAFDLSQESPKLRQRYGETVNGISLLMARRLVEAGVPFVTVFWKENEAIKDKCKSAGGWDTHGNNFNCLQEYLLPEFDRAYSALLEDLHDRGLLSDTLVMVTSEMGRKPKIGDPRSGGISGAGRDHWTACQSDLLAGGGIRGGQIFGETDKHAEYPEHHPVDPADITQTVYHAMGIEEILKDSQGRPVILPNEGGPILDLF